MYMFNCHCTTALFSVQKGSHYTLHDNIVLTAQKKSLITRLLQEEGKHRYIMNERENSLKVETIKREAKQGALIAVHRRHICSEEDGQTLGNKE